MRKIKKDVKLLSHFIEEKRRPSPLPIKISVLNIDKYSAPDFDVNNLTFVCSPLMNSNENIDNKISHCISVRYENIRYPNDNQTIVTPLSCSQNCIQHKAIALCDLGKRRHARIDKMEKLGFTVIEYGPKNIPIVSNISNTTTLSTNNNNTTENDNDDGNRLTDKRVSKRKRTRT